MSESETKFLDSKFESLEKSVDSKFGLLEKSIDRQGNWIKWAGSLMFGAAVLISVTSLKLTLDTRDLVANKPECTCHRTLAK